LALQGSGGDRKLTNRIVVVEPLGFWGSSHSETCYHICGPWRGAGEDVSVHTGLVARADPFRILRPSLPRLLPSALKARLQDRFGPALLAGAERRALSQLRPGDILYCWPGTSLDTMEKARNAGAFVVSEFINSHIAFARTVLEAEHQKLGLPPPAITDADVAADDRRLDLSNAVFAPGPQVSPSIRARRPDIAAAMIIEASYGCLVPDAVPQRPVRKSPLVFLFVGTLGVRKGATHLLQAWKKARLDADLWIAGNIDASFKPHLPDLVSDRVTFFPYRMDIATLYQQADVFVFPSLEEGGPQVTYEAAAFGLPLIVTRAGGGRIANADTALEVDASSSGALVEAMTRLAGDADLRRSLGDAARRASLHYAWDKVALRRLADLKQVVAGQAGSGGR
jgi:glycosyltransferase involved in cell wall biosynthesis